MWLYSPFSDRWSIHEIIHHLADSEATGYVQCRTFIAEPGSRFMQLNPARWTDSLGYFHQSTREALEIIRRLRKMTYGLLATLPESARSYALEDANNGEMFLEHWLGQQERHIPHHIEQIKENYDLWLTANPPRKTPLAEARLAGAQSAEAQSVVQPRRSVLSL
jgi:DinB superfamily